ncbi:DUF6090 family protein [Arenibacter sp. GZD96]|uniref:DUF6090 family protein n=1 Tax=Aurantibrevibacter litoralis TaxID=3106030 RepID=UPI002AFEEA1D|nr:DUF6090 family protein [Arenibacter sp. GZD-96]MEA1786061.1 DUF6090 family protein [Arenibacter sp. GZD-96]
MIKFFRNIRKKLLQQNKVTRYLAYAIGEIILVVIGILIALQVNTWNEVKKNKVFENEILTQIKENLLQDKKALVTIAGNFEMAYNSSNKLIIVAHRNSFPDSIPYWLGHVAQFDRFQPITNSYEVLKSKGLDIVSDTELRHQLGQYYDDKINHTVKAMGDIELSFNEEWLPLMRDHITDFKFKTYVKVTSMDHFFEHTNVVRILILNRDNYNAARNYVKSVIVQIDELVALIP